MTSFLGTESRGTNEIIFNIDFEKDSYKLSNFFLKKINRTKQLSKPRVDRNKIIQVCGTQINRMKDGRQYKYKGELELNK